MYIIGNKCNYCVSLALSLHPSHNPWHSICAFVTPLSGMKHIGVCMIILIHVIFFSPETRIQIQHRYD